MIRRHSAVTRLLFVLGTALATRALATSAPGIVLVPARAVIPNAFTPAVACTLALTAPGDRLLAPGLRFFADQVVTPTPAGDFVYLPFTADDYRFDQVNVFFHAQRFLARLQRYGLDPLEIPINLTVLRATGSGTHPTEPNSFIGTGDGGLNADAKDSDIIVHEITHAVFNPRMPTDQYVIDRGESQPLAEGLADYFAAAVNGDTRMGEYSSPPNGYHDIASDPAVYNYQRWDLLPADPYARGRVMNGALLEMRSQLGETADELTYAAVETRPLRCMTCFADAVRWADAARYGGSHLPVIDAAFARRGIGSGPPSHLAVTGPPWAWAGDRVRFQAKHHCGAGPFRARWQFTADAGGTTTVDGDADTVEFTAGTSGRMDVVLTDRLGSEYALPGVHLAVYSPDDPTLRLRGVEIHGPKALVANEASDFSYSLISGGVGVAPASAKWAIQNGVITRGRDTDPVIGVISRGGTVTVGITYSDAIGQQVSASSVVPQVAKPAMTLNGPAELGEGQLGRFAANVTGGLPPYRYEWVQTTPTRSVVLPDSAVVMATPSDEDYEIGVRVTDQTDRTLAQSIQVRMLPTVATGGSAPARRFRVLGSRVPRGGTLTLELPAGAGRSTLEVLDLAGRVLVRSRLGTDPAARLDVPMPTVADAGVYFARLVTVYGTRVARFVVLPR